MGVTEMGFAEHFGHGLIKNILLGKTLSSGFQ